eukprot:2818154-Pyramimonas_sp.AAC.1
MLGYAVLDYAMSRHAMPCYALIFNAMLCHVLFCAALAQAVWLKPGAAQAPRPPAGRGPAAAPPREAGEACSASATPSARVAAGRAMPPKGVKKHIKKAQRVESGDGGSGLRRSKTVEQIYQKKTPVEHILLRPDTYVGSAEKPGDSLWIWDSKKEDMDFRSITYVPALYKIFDEML